MIVEFYGMKQEKDKVEGEEHTTICPCRRHMWLTFTGGACVAVALDIVPHLCG